MPLIHYSTYLTYPDSSPAANAAFAVRPLGGNVLVPLFSDKAGTLPLANPVMTDGDGLATFYAAPESLFTDVSGAMFHYAVDPTETDDAWPGMFAHEQTSPATVWTVEHHFGIEPAVHVLVDGQATEADVTHPDAETTTIIFGTPTAGVAHLRR